MRGSNHCQVSDPKEKAVGTISHAAADPPYVNGLVSHKELKRAFIQDALKRAIFLPAIRLPRKAAIVLRLNYCEKSFCYPMKAVGWGGEGDTSYPTIDAALLNAGTS